VKKSDFNIFRFLALFIILIEGFYLYVGIISTGGKFYSPFLAKYFNFPHWLTIVVAKSSSLFLQLLGYSVHQANPANISINGATGVTIVWPCLGMAPISLWIGFIAAHRYKTSYKLKWIIAGIGIIFLVNVLRIAVIALSYYHKWFSLEHFNAHTSFNILTYAIILLLMYIFIKDFNFKKNARALKA
jgi:exosortase/archaeosortase family protein